ncbi:MAG TPA: cytochrome c oxidase subunit 3 [Rhizomicrobium sp.]|nr:cytochrome c oxidase subunit 3 [Rhizomicrobium sp.]
MANSEVKHDYHLVDPSPWPIVGSIAAFTMLVGAVFWMNKDYTGFFGLPVNGQPWIFAIGAFLVLFTMAGWWRDVVSESVVRGQHTPVVKLNLRYGMLLFIASEVMFFVAWFWAYFNSAIFFNDVQIGSWPPSGIVTLDPWHFPLLNTLILLTSGTTVTWAHHALQHGDRKGAIQGLIITVLLGASFTCVQAYEYAHAPFTFGFNHAALTAFKDAAHINLAAANLNPVIDLINPASKAMIAGGGDLGAIYGSTFFMATGFHGFHVIIGTIFLAVCLFRAIAGQFTPTRHFGFEAAAWYWHFVDVVWLFLFACIYVWGAGPVTVG